MQASRTVPRLRPVHRGTGCLLFKKQQHLPGYTGPAKFIPWVEA